MNFSTEWKQTHRCREQTCGGQGRGGGGGKGLRIWDYQLQIIIYRMDKQQDPTLGASLVVQW